MAGDMLPNVSLPLLTTATKYTKWRVTNALPISTRIGARGAKTIGGFGLVRPPITIAYQFWQCGRVMDTVGMVLITIAYHIADLALTLLWLAFTNDYHRDQTTHNHQWVAQWTRRPGCKYTYDRAWQVG